jgi:hypothetical protein
MVDPIFMTTSLLSQVINLGGKDKKLKCLFSEKMQVHTSVSMAEGMDDGIWKILGRVNDYNPLSWGTWGAVYVCNHCGFIRTDGGLLSDWKNDQLLKEAKKAVEFYRIYLHNKTYDDISVAIRYYDIEDEWETKGWFSFEPDEKALVCVSRKPYFYYYAFNNKGEYWGSNDYTDSVRNSDKKYGFKKQTINVENWGTYTLRFTDN